MGIDYIAYHGIGYEVEEGDDLPDFLYEGENLYEHIENNLGEGFSCFETGNNMTGDLEGIFITTDDPFAWGLDLHDQKLVLDEELKRLGVKPVGEFGSVGGLLIW